MGIESEVGTGFSLILIEFHAFSQQFSGFGAIPVEFDQILCGCPIHATRALAHIQDLNTTKSRCKSTKIYLCPPRRNSHHLSKASGPVVGFVADSARDRPPDDENVIRIGNQCENRTH